MQLFQIVNQSQNSIINPKKAHRKSQKHMIKILDFTFNPIQRFSLAIHSYAKEIHKNNAKHLKTNKIKDEKHSKIFPSYNLNPHQKKKRIPQIQDGNPLIFGILFTFSFQPTFDLQKYFYGICSKLQSRRYLILLSFTARIRSIKNLCKKL